MTTELILETFGKLTIEDGTPFPLNFNIQNLNKPESTPSNYSKNITIIGDAASNRILGQAYDVNVTNSTFDINKKVRCNVLQDGANVFENGLFQLLSVERTGESLANGQPIVRYTGRVKSSKMSFFSDIKNRDLTDLDLTDDYEILNKANIIASFNNTSATDKWKYVPIYNEGVNWKAKYFRPGIYLKTYWDAIHEQNGWVYEFDEFNDINLDKLIVPYTQEFDADEKTKNFATVLGEDTVVHQYNFDCKAGYARFGVLGSNELDGGIPQMDNETQDNFNQYNTLNSTLTSSFNSTFLVRWEMEYEYILENPTAGDVVLTGTPGDILRITQGLQHRIGNTAFYTNQIEIASFTIGDTLPSGLNTISSGTLVMEASIQCNAGDELQAFRTWQEWRNTIDETRRIDWRPVGSPNEIRSLCGTLNITNTKIEYIPELQYNVGTPILLNDFIPREVSQADFIKSIINMYRLVVDIDPTQENKLIYKTRNKYYDDGAEKDWTLLQALDKPSNIDWLINKQSAIRTFTYKQDDDYFNVGYKNETKDVYGEFKYHFGNEYNVGDDKIEVIFSPTPIVKSSESGMFLPALTAGAEKENNIRLLYDGGVRNAYWFMQNDDGTYPTTNNSDYPHITHFDDAVNPSVDLNFGLCDFYFYNDYTPTYNNLFNLYHRRYIGQQTNGRIMTAYFNLEPKDILDFDLSDRVFIKDTWWNVNRVIDYNANSDSLTKVELISVDDGIEIKGQTSLIGEDTRIGSYGTSEDPLTPYSPLKLNPTDPAIFKAVRESQIAKLRNLDNTISAGSKSEVYGDSNLLGRISEGLVLGDRNIQGSKSIIIGDDSNDSGFPKKLIVGDDIEATNDYDIATNSIDVKDRIKIGDVVIDQNTFNGVGNIVWIRSKEDFPEADMSNNIQLLADTVYFILGDIDLTTDVLVGASNTALIGTTSETSSLTTASGSPLFTSSYTTPIKNLTFKDSKAGVNIDGLGNNVALDWLAVNFVQVDDIGIIQNVNNFIYTNGAFINSQQLSFDGTIGTISFSGSYLSGDSTLSQSTIKVKPTATVDRRFRIIYSTVNSEGNNEGIYVDATTTIPNEGFILDTVNFEGNGSYLTGLDYTSNKASFKNCTGIINSDEIAQYYMNGNATATTIATIGTAVKIAGTTTAASFNQKFDHTDNKATYVGSRKRFFKVAATLSAESGNNNEIGIYIAKNGTLLTESEVYITTNAGGRAENGVVQTIVELEQDDYIEIFVENDTSTSDVTVSELNVIVG